MWSHSTQFLPALGAAHRIAVRVDVFDGAGTLLESDLPFTPDSSAVQVDATSATRRTLTLSVPDVRAYMPYLPGDTLAPYGQQLQVYRGIVLGGTPELMPVGRFRLDDPALRAIGEIVGAIPADFTPRELVPTSASASIMQAQPTGASVTQAQPTTGPTA